MIHDIKQNGKRKQKRAGLWILCCVVLLIASGIVYFISSPKPGSWIIRRVFEKDAVKVNQALEKHITIPVSSVLDLLYAEGDPDAYLNVYYPETIGENELLPVIVWIHGGGWVAGNKEQTANYNKILAGKGFAVAVIDYTLAPNKHYPYQIGQLNKALAYLAANAKHLHMDIRWLFLAGDSGGASIAAQYANMLTSPPYAGLIGIEPLIEPAQLAGVLLYCGPYDIGMVNWKGGFGWFVKTISWAYSGKKDFMSVPGFEGLSVSNYVTKNFPPAYISAGNKDPLLNQSGALANKLSGMGVPVDTLFFPANYVPGLPHEYQFNLDNDAGKIALERSVEFLKKIYFAQ